MTAIKISLSKTVGKGYNRFWHFKGRYRVVKGSRASKKSKTTALWFIANLMKYPQANLLVIRKTYRTLKDSCFTELKWAIHRLQADNWWEIKESPLEMTYKPTGQKIYFRGLDDPLKVTSQFEVKCLKDCSNSGQLLSILGMNIIGLKNAFLTTPMKIPSQ